MKCLWCHCDAFTIRGLCRQCSPELHAQHGAQLKVFTDADAAYKQATGRSALSDWFGFERFMESPDIPSALKQCYVEAFCSEK